MRARGDRGRQAAEGEADPERGALLGHSRRWWGFRDRDLLRVPASLGGSDGPRRGSLLPTPAGTGRAAVLSHVGRTPPGGDDDAGSGGYRAAAAVHPGGSAGETRQHRGSLLRG